MNVFNGFLLVSGVIIFCRIVKNKAILQYKKTLIYNYK